MIEFIGGSILGGIAVIVVFGIVDYCISRLIERDRLAVAPDQKVFSGSNTYRVLALLFLMFIVGVTYAVFFHMRFLDEASEWIVRYAVLLVGAPLTYYILKDAFFTQITVGSEGIHKKGNFSSKQVLWSEIDSVWYSSTNRCFLLRGDGRTLMRIGVLMSGIPTIVAHLRKQVAADALTPALPMLEFFGAD